MSQRDGQHDREDAGSSRQPREIELARAGVSRLQRRRADAVGHLSTPPMIGSRLAMMAIVSAIRLPGISSADRLEVEERRVVDPQPERLVGAVADGVARVLAARALDRDEGAARAGRGAGAAAWP